MGFLSYDELSNLKHSGLVVQKKPFVDIYRQKQNMYLQVMSLAAVN